MPPRGVTILALPTDVLVSILGRLELNERHGSTALVCRRWREAANSPQLLQDLHISISDDDSGDFLPRLQSLNAWFISKAAQHVQRLNLDLCASADDKNEELNGLLMAMLGGCGAGRRGQLTDLKLELNWRVSAGGGLAWLGGSLQKLDIRCNELSVGSLQGLSGLQELLWSYEGVLSLPPSAHLPPSLTKLCLRHPSDEALPQQVGSLSRLADLELAYAGDLEAEGYAPLLQLCSSLKKLTLELNHYLPACLPQLTSLESLVIWPGFPAPDAAGVPAALRQLTALTSLLLGTAPGMPGPPAELAGLSRLRRLVWWDDAPHNAALPGGPWLGSLNRLMAPAAVLANSLHQLAATAGQLGCLGVTQMAHSQEAAGAVLTWLPGATSLRCILLEAPFLKLELAAAALRAQHAMQLCIELRPSAAKKFGRHL